MSDREKVIGLLQEMAEYFRECRNNASFNSKAENHFWELQNAANKAVKLLKEQEAREQCLKTKCVICPHCSNCDVDENGQLKKQEPMKPHRSGTHTFCAKCGAAFKNSADFCPHCGQEVKWNEP